jgi:hypothetical protein
MSVRRTVTVAGLVMLAWAAGACGGDDRTRVREMSADERRREGTLALADSSVIRELRTPRAPGLIIYDPPVDLSLATAQRTRPDLVGADTLRRDTASTPRRDTTGGDATADTSGGAARRRRP